jgi:HD-GYP domain-containing protein (c-di-GMP phosphodiesterase class II)
MRLIATRRLEDGCVLARDVLTGRSDAIPLLRSGVAITPRYRDALLAAGIHAVYVDDELSAGVEVRPVISEETRREASAAVSHAFETTSQALADGRALPSASVEKLEQIARLIAHDVEGCPDAALALSDLSSADSYTLQHSIDVAALGLLLADRLFRRRGWLNYRGRYTWEEIDKRLVKLGVGLLLHDIGKLAVPVEILNKPDRLDDEERKLMRTHPTAGVEMLKSDLISPLIKVVVRAHHERWDGRGYPAGLVRDKTNELARIATVADVYDAVTSERVYAPAKPAHVGVQVICDGAGSQFDAEIVDVFRSVVPPYPKGAEVDLSNGTRAIVADVAPEAIDRPVVRVGWDHTGTRIDPVEIALADHPELDIVGAPTLHDPEPTRVRAAA